MGHALSLVAIGVEGDAIVLFRLQPQHLRSNVLESAQQLPIAVQQKTGVRSLALDVDVPSLEAVWVRCTRSCGNPVLESKTSGGGQNAHQRGYFLSRLGKVFHGFQRPQRKGRLFST